MKYEMIFGDESLFDGAPEDSVIAIKRPFIRGVRSEKIYFFSTTFDAVMMAGSCFNFNNVILKTDEYAERRIIKEPKQWTWEDKKAGRLPEIGSMIWFINDMKQVEFAGTDGGNYLWYFKRDSGAFGSAYFNCFKPIESPEEKARRERDAWARKASEFIDDELDCVNLVGEHVMRRFYNAMLSGDLPVPVAPEQNK